MNLLEKKSALEAKWEFDSGMEIMSAPAIADLDDDGLKEVIFATRTGRVCALKSGKVMWFYDASEAMTETEKLFSGEALNSIQGSPAVADINGDGRPEIIIGCETGLLYVLSSSGKPIWRFRAGAPIRTTPLVYDIDRDGRNEIVFGTSGGSVYALDSQGKVLWGVKADSPGESSCVVIDKKSVQEIFGSNSGRVYSVSNGKLAWSFKANDKVIAAPVAGNIYGNAETFIVFGSFDKNLYVLDEGGRLCWSYSTEGKIASEALLADINGDGKLEIIFGSCDDSVYVLSAEGRKLWSYETDFWVAAQSKAVDINQDGKMEVIAGSYDNSVYVFGAEGNFSLNYMPGLSGVMQQPGHYTELISAEVGSYIGKLLLRYNAGGIVTGISVAKERGGEMVVVATGNGKIIELQHKR